MAWTIEISSAAERQLRKLDKTTAKRLASYLQQVVADSAGPRTRGKPLA